MARETQLNTGGFTRFQAVRPARGRLRAPRSILCGMTDADGHGASDSAAESFRAVASVVLPMVAQADLSELESYDDSHTVFTGDEVRAVTLTRRAFGGWLYKHQGEIAAATSLDACIDLHLSRGLVSESSYLPPTAIPRTESDRRAALRSVILRPLALALQETDPRVPSIDEVMERYRQHLPVWQATELERVIRIPLGGFEYDGQPSRFGPHFRLATMNDDDKTEMWNVMPLGWPFAAEDLAKVSWQLEHRSTSPIHSSGSPKQDVIDEAQRLKHALQLHQRGEVWFLVIADYGLPQERSNSASAMGFYKPIPWWQNPPRYHLRDGAETEIERLRTLLAAHEQVLQVALRRFDMISERRLHEDRLIDLMIALDSSVLYRTSSNGAVMAHRGAQLASPPRNKASVEAFLRVMYRARNRVVHDGGQFSALDAEMRRLFSSDNEMATGPYELADVTRLILVRLLELLNAGESLEAIGRRLGSP
jgi:hypothetical protein